MKLYHHVLSLTLISILATACSTTQPMGPADVAEAFWTAVLKEDRAAMQHLSAQGTLDETSPLDNFELKFTGFQVGDAQMHERTAQVATRFTKDANGEEKSLPITTSMIKEDDAWKVDGRTSMNSLAAASMAHTMSDLEQTLSTMGEAFSQSMASGLQEFLKQLNNGMPAIKKEMEKFSDEEKAKELGEQLGSTFSESLQEAMQEFTKGLESLSEELDKAEKENRTQPKGEKI